MGVLLVMEAAKVRGREEMPEAEKKTIEANRRTKVTAHPHLQAMVPQPPVTMEHHLRNLHRATMLQILKQPQRAMEHLPQAVTVPRQPQIVTELQTTNMKTAYHPM